MKPKHRSKVTLPVLKARAQREEIGEGARTTDARLGLQPSFLPQGSALRAEWAHSRSGATATTRFRVATGMEMSC